MCYNFKADSQEQNYGAGLAAEPLVEYNEVSNVIIGVVKKELQRICNEKAEAYFNGCTCVWMFGLAIVSWAIILASQSINMRILLGRMLTVQILKHTGRCICI